jgi:hypothetical protein
MKNLKEFRNDPSNFDTHYIIVRAEGTFSVLTFSNGGGGGWHW